MSWLDPNWKYRLPLAVDNTTWTSGTIDAAISIPNELDDFWAKVQSTGNDVRVCLPDGAKVASYDIDNWNATTRTGTLEINDYLPKGAGTQQFWLYWGNAAAPDSKTAFIPSSAKGGAIELASPGVRIVVVKPERPGELKPATVLGKMASEAVTVWWDFRSVLLNRQRPFSKSNRYEEIDYCNYDVLANDASQAPMIDTSRTRFFDGGVGTLVKAGTSGSTYTALCRVVTSLGRTLEGRALIKVQNPKE